MNNKLIDYVRNRRAQRGKNNNLSIGDVCAILHCAVPANVNQDTKLTMICCFDGVFVKDCLYVHYERDDDYLARRAINNGACVLLSHHQIEDFPCIIVNDVLTALNQILKELYEPVRIPATVITGSCGKTTTKNFVNSVYSMQFNTFCNITNGNTFEYLGFEIQKLDKKAEVFVQEVNESDYFNAKNCSEILKPQIALITNMDKSHIGELGGEENIIKAICDITSGMDENGIVIINVDDKNSIKPVFKQKVITVSMRDKKADCYAECIDSCASKTEFDLIYKNEKVHVTIPVGGLHNIYNAQMAYVAGRLNGISPQKIIRGIQKYKPLGFRQNVYTSFSNRIYADCYNASAKSVGYAIQYLNEMKCKGRKIIVLGDIAEIEGYEEDTYKEIAQCITNSDASILITFGRDSQQLHKMIKSDISMYHESNQADLTTRIKMLNSKNDCYLFKGSRSMHLEEVIKLTFPFAYYKGMIPVGWKYMKWVMRTL